MRWLLCLALLLAPSVAFGQAWYSDYGYRIAVTTDSDSVDTGQASFPYLLDLSQMPASFFTNAKSDGSDILVTTSNGTTVKNRELAAYDDTGQTGQLYWSNLLSSSVDQTFYIYYGKSDTTISNSTDPWVSDVIGAWHIEDASIATTIVDSGPDGNDLTVNTAASTGTGYLGQGAVLSAAGTPSYDVSITSNTSDNWTITALVDPIGSVGTTRNVVYMGGKYISNGSVVGAGDDRRRMAVYDGSWKGATIGQIVDEDDGWGHAAWVWNATDDSVYCFRNGVPTTDAIPYSGTMSTVGTIVTWYWAGTGSFDGNFDELRIYDVAKTHEWVLQEARCLTRNSDFWKTIGSEESMPVASTAAPIGFSKPMPSIRNGRSDAIGGG